MTTRNQSHVSNSVNRRGRILIFPVNRDRNLCRFIHTPISRLTTVQPDSRLWSASRVTDIVGQTTLKIISINENCLERLPLGTRPTNIQSRNRRTSESFKKNQKIFYPKLYYHRINLLFLRLIYFFQFLNFIDRSIRLIFWNRRKKKKRKIIGITISGRKLPRGNPYRVFEIGVKYMYCRIFVAWCGGAGCFSFCLVVRHPVSARVSEQLVGIIRNHVTNKCYIVVRNIHSRDAIPLVIAMFAIEM